MVAGNYLGHDAHKDTKTNENATDVSLFYCRLVGWRKGLRGDATTGSVVMRMFFISAVELFSTVKWTSVFGQWTVPPPYSCWHVAFCDMLHVQKGAFFSSPSFFVTENVSRVSGWTLLLRNLVTVAMLVATSVLTMFVTTSSGCSAKYDTGSDKIFRWNVRSRNQFGLLFYK